MSYAIIETSGGQRRVSEGDEITIDLHEGGEAQAGSTITFEHVLLVGGDTAKIGTPYVEGASVTAEVMEPMVKGEKIHIIKYRPKKGYRRKTGHRQRYTQGKITGIKG